ncbi:hypothetical protein TNCV_675371 [Trichonephila clavipes]|nr:hypothetical protein TNCV_675371 [Trichonephila clavipes]
MATNTGQDVGSRDLCHVAIRTSGVNFKICHKPLSSSMSAAKHSKNLFISPTANPSQSIPPRRFPSYHSCEWDYLQEALMSCLSQVAISEKVRQPPCVESLWLSSRVRPFAISFSQTFL